MMMAWRAWQRSACLSSYRAALSLPLVRCCCSVRLRCGLDCPVQCDLPRLLDCLGFSVACFLIEAF